MYCTKCGRETDNNECQFCGHKRAFPLNVVSTYKRLRITYILLSVFLLYRLFGLFTGIYQIIMHTDLLPYYINPSYIIHMFLTLLIITLLIIILTTQFRIVFQSKTDIPSYSVGIILAYIISCIALLLFGLLSLFTLLLSGFPDVLRNLNYILLGIIIPHSISVTNIVLAIVYYKSMRTLQKR